MEWVLLGVLVLFLLLALAGSRGSTPPLHTWSERQVERDESAVSYRDRAGTLRRETDGCNGCIQVRAEQLQRKGYVVEEVEIGRRNSGDL